jgi:hypothetical protein
VWFRLLVGLPAVQDCYLAPNICSAKPVHAGLGRQRYAVNFLTGQSRTGGQLNADPYCNAGICVALLGRGFDQYSCLSEL